MAAETKAERNPLGSAISVLKPQFIARGQTLPFPVLRRLEPLGSDLLVNRVGEVETKL